jgi:hypothetical protein
MAKNKYYSGSFNKQDSNNDSVLESDESISEETTTEEQVTETVKEEVTKPVVSSSAPQVVEEVKQVKKQNSTSEQKGFKPVYKVELDLTSYMEEMDPKKAINPEEGGKWQYSLFTILRNIFNTDSQEQFNAEFNTVLNFFNKNRKADNALSENFIYRPYMWTGSEKEYVVFRKLIQLIIETADPKGRKSFVSKIDFSKTFSEMKEEERQKLINFFG